jgi:Family of unknown function (DUF6308)
MSPEAKAILDVFGARGLRAGASVDQSEFWRAGLIQDDASRRGLAELLQGHYLHETLATFILTEKGASQVYGSDHNEESSGADRVKENVIRLIEDPRTRRLVEFFFDDGGPFAGATFHTLEPNNLSSFDQSDLLAVSLLDVLLPAKTVRQMLYDSTLRDAVSGMLEGIDGDKNLWDPGAPLEPAEGLWDFLQDNFDGIGEVTAGKLLARKRPLLVPIVDTVVVHVLQGEPGKYWESIRMALSDEGLRRHVDDLGSGLKRAVPTLRLLDAAIWMTGSDSDNARQRRRELGFDLGPKWRRFR